MKRVASSLSYQADIANEAKSEAEDREQNDTYCEIEFKDDTPSLNDLFRDL